jgi:plastocyanin
MPVALPLAASPVFLTIAGVFVLFAVVVSVLGLRSDRFAGNAAGARVVLGLAGLLLVAVAATAVITAESPAKDDVEPLHKPKSVAPPTAPLAGGGSSSASSGGSAPAAPSGPATNQIKISAVASGQLAYNQKSVAAKAGKDTIDFDNPAPTPHDVVIVQGTKKLAETKTIAGKKVTASVTLKPGKYTFFCSVDSHRQAGMEGTLTVK